MEPSVWAKIQSFLRECFKEKFKIFFPGSLLGLFAGKSLLFSGLPAELVTFGAYLLKFVGTVLMAVASGAATTYGAKWVEKKLSPNEKKSPDPIKKGRNKNAA